MFVARVGYVAVGQPEIKLPQSECGGGRRRDAEHQGLALRQMVSADCSVAIKHNKSIIPERRWTVKRGGLPKRGNYFGVAFDPLAEVVPPETHTHRAATVER